MALADVLSLVPSTSTMWLTTACKFSSRGSEFLALQAFVHLYTWTYTSTTIKK